MSHKFITIVALAVLLIVPPLVGAAIETVYKLVQEVDMDTKSSTLKV